MRSTYVLASVPLVLASLAAPNRAQQDAERARTLFVANCATCHGETGDGKGTTQLDRPARSFMDGGFSFGNTPEALFRTISVGIPGTPMPGFDSSLSEADRKLVASFVVTLGPPIEEVAEEDTILAVHDKPLVVRGLLPPIAEGAPPQPRGLLIGDPSGITFEYRVDDVRLLGLRQGGFVKRTDWSGRGGTPLEPLGKVVHLVEGGKPGATFHRGNTPLSARLSSTSCAGGANGHGLATLEYHLVDPSSNEVSHVTETPRVVSTPFGTGYWRHFELRGQLPIDVVGPPVTYNAEWLSKRGGQHWYVSTPENQPALLVGMRSPIGLPPSEAGENMPPELAAKVLRSLQLRLQPATTNRAGVAEMDITVLSLFRWDAEARAQVERWVEAQ